MAKNKTPKMDGGMSDYQQIQRNIQKAKGNPNKNVHHKKNNSNSAGYQNPAIKEQERRAEEESMKMPMPVKIALGVCMALLILMMFLLNGPFEGNVLAGHVTSLLSGITCLVVYYSQRWSPRKGKFLTVMGYILLFLGAIFIGMGCYGIYLTLKG